MGGLLPVFGEICRHYTIDLPPNLPTFGGKLAQDGGKSSAYIGEGNGLHRTPKVLTSAAERPYILDEMRFDRGADALRRRQKDINPIE